MSELTDLNMVQLKISVQIAAMPADRQIARLSKGVVVADEIALDFYNWCQWAIRGSDAPALTDEQRLALSSLDELFDEMSGERNSKLWTEAALQTRPEWREVRRRAQKILDLFGWSTEE